ncbi:MAG: VOC family protein [Alphaproteobacteria bacterium]|nr:VOC family protein [Alphaproteobacteria bacterium]
MRLRGIGADPMVAPRAAPSAARDLPGRARMPVIGGIDHVVIIVRDLDAARLRIGRLGFAPTPRGGHPVLGTGNHTVMFREPTYFETMGIERPGPHTARYAEFLARREGIGALALKTDDARRVHAEHGGAPLHASPVVDFARPVDLPSGRVEARFTLSQFDAAATPGVSAFACQHHTPGVVWRQDMLDHPNGAVGLAFATIVVEDPRAAAAAYAWLWPGPARHEDGLCEIDTGTCPLRLVSPARFAAENPGDPLLAQSAPFCAEIGVRVRDRDAAAALLAGAGVAHRRATDGCVALPSSEGCGAIFKFC